MSFVNRKPPRMRSASGGSGTFPKAEDMIGELVIVEPREIESVPAFGEDKKPAGVERKMTDRLIADVTFLTGDRSGEKYKKMWLTQSGLITAAAKILAAVKDSPDEEPEIIAGRLFRKPKRDVQDRFPTWRELEKAIADIGARSLATSFWWDMEDPTPADLELINQHYQELDDGEPAKPEPGSPAPVDSLFA